MTLLIQSSENPNPAGSHAAIKTLIRLSEDAFEGDPKHSILGNIRDFDDEKWTVVPPGGGRSVADIVEHVAWGKWMYEDYAFGSASLRGDQPPLVSGTGVHSRPRDKLLTWLIDGHRRWLTSVHTLRNDAELDHPRLAYWGEHLPTRVIIYIVLAHDLYHAGEINHLRALLQGTDHWPET